MKPKMLRLFLLLLYVTAGFAQPTTDSGDFTISRLKYSGGGDWYNDPSIIPNMLSFLKKNTNITTGKDQTVVEISDEELFSYPVLFMTGHGKISFSKSEAERLRKYLLAGGFLYADDDYGMDKSFREEIKKVFPDKKLVELPFSHEIFHNHFNFPSGSPKIHEHDGGPPKTYGIFHDGRMVVFYTFDTNISDGWADPEVHGDPENIRQKAFEMGTNIIVYALTN